jgi:PRTRC genetic system protein E
MIVHQNYTLPCGLLLLALGLLIRYHIGRRRFNRRGIGGLQQFPTYGRFIFTMIVKRVIDFIATLCLLVGLFFLAEAGFNHLKFYIMKTNCFQQIAGLGFKGNFLLNIHQEETGGQTISVVLKKDKAIDGLPPMLFKASPEELDEDFFEQLARPAKETAGLFNNLESYQKELDKAKKIVRPDKAKANKPADNEQDDEHKDDENNLFTPPGDDKEAT